MPTISEFAAQAFAEVLPPEQMYRVHFAFPVTLADGFTMWFSVVREVMGDTLLDVAEATIRNALAYGRVRPISGNSYEITAVGEGVVLSISDKLTGVQSEVG